MNEPVVLEWSFSPPDFFEDPVQIPHKDCKLTIEKGKVEARIDAEIYDKNPLMREELQKLLDYWFLGAQVLAHKPYELSKPSICRLHPGGRRDVTVEAADLMIMSDVGSPDLRLGDANGNVIVDSRKDRVEKKRELAKLAEKWCSKDPTTASLLRSYNAAVADPANELARLYEIREALTVRFNGQPETRAALGISDTPWSDFGRLANNEPIKQGRHTGGKTGIPLRDATDAELSRARTFARNLVEDYMQYLERQARIAEVLLKGAWYSLEQCGYLLQNAVTLHAANAYSSEVALALLAREELGRYRILLDLWRKASGGTPVSVEEVRARCDDHVVKQREAQLSITYRAEGSGGLAQLLRKRIQARPGTPEFRNVDEQLKKLDEMKLKRTPGDRHSTRMKALYVDINDQGTDWNRPTAISKGEATNCLVDAINDYAVQVNKVNEPDILRAFDATLATALDAWQGKPPLLVPTWPETTGNEVT